RFLSDPWVVTHGYSRSSPLGILSAVERLINSMAVGAGVRASLRFTEPLRQRLQFNGTLPCSTSAKVTTLIVRVFARYSANSWSTAIIGSFGMLASKNSHQCVTRTVTVRLTTLA